MKNLYTWFQNHQAPLMGLVAAIATVAMLNSQILLANAKQWITPAQAAGTSLAQVEATPVSQDERLIIPQINVNAAIVTDMTKTDEAAVAKALESGVLQFGNSPNPGKGNTVIVGHSSNGVFAAGDYNFIFVLLNRLQPSDKFMIDYAGQRYIYKVAWTKVVMPSNLEVLKPTTMPTVTLITCAPVGTNLKRLVVRAEQLSPEPQAINNQDVKHIRPAVLPGSS